MNSLRVNSPQWGDVVVLFVINFARKKINLNVAWFRVKISDAEFASVWLYGGTVRLTWTTQIARIPTWLDSTTLINLRTHGSPHKISLNLIIENFLTPNKT